MVLQCEKCEKCDEQYIDCLYAKYKWCGPCQINYLNKNFTSWTSKNEKIDNLIQKMQLNINSYHDMVFEWIQYNQFNDIKEIDKGDCCAMYSAIWKDGPLCYDYFKKKEWIRETYKKVALKCLYNSQSITEFLIKV